MKNSNDKATIELFETPKKLGRPKKENAQTSAERQARYRHNKQHRECKANLNIWIDEKEKTELDELAAHFLMSKEEMIEKLIKEAKKKLSEDLFNETWSKS
jgi:hypothetical protein